MIVELLGGCSRRPAHPSMRQRSFKLSFDVLYRVLDGCTFIGPRSLDGKELLTGPVGHPVGSRRMRGKAKEASPPPFRKGISPCLRGDPLTKGRDALSNIRQLGTSANRPARIFWCSVSCFRMARRAQPRGNAYLGPKWSRYCAPTSAGLLCGSDVQCEMMRRSRRNGQTQPPGICG